MKELDSSQISLSTPSKSFAYEQISRQIADCDDIILLKEALRCYVKLYFKQQEVLRSVPVPHFTDEK